MRAVYRESPAQEITAPPPPSFAVPGRVVAWRRLPGAAWGVGTAQNNRAGKKMRLNRIPVSVSYIEAPQRAPALYRPNRGVPFP